MPDDGMTRVHERVDKMEASAARHDAHIEGLNKRMDKLEDFVIGVNDFREKVALMAGQFKFISWGIMLILGSLVGIAFEVFSK
ncbi:MAG: hypothetical protein ACRC1W_11365 [Shewanella sp.]